MVNLNAHSYYSLLAGIPSPADLVAAAAGAGQTALALTDHNRLTGSIEFTLACQEAGIKPILGMQVTMQTPRSMGGDSLPLILLVMNAEGWASLCRLSSWLQNEERGDERELPLSHLEENHAGLMVIANSPSYSGTGRGSLSFLKERIGNRLYLGILDENRLVQNLSKSLGVETVALWPIYYLRPEQADLQRTLTAMRLNVTRDQLTNAVVAPPDSYFPSPAQMEARFSLIPEALRNTDLIADRCTFELPLGKQIFPELDLPNGQTPLEALREKAYAGARSLYPDITQEIEARLEHEIAAIEASGYTTLFLIMEEILSFARKADVPVSSRGSASSSLVAHCLGITSPDPIRLNLYFERFLNPARPTPPDVDIDICSRRRDILIHHVYEHYGHDRVAMVATINRFRRRSALREVAKAHGLAPAQIKSMVEMLPYRFWGPPGGLPETGSKPFGELEARFPDSRSQLIFRDAEAILDTPHHLSIHPGGIVISSGRLTDLVPTQFSGKGVTVTQYDLEGVQKVGLVKMDFLGIRGLTVLGDVADQIRMHHPELGDSRLEVLENIPDGDPQTAAIVRVGATIGCFQIESPGMRATMREVQSDNIDNLMVALALFRPGPLTGGLKDAFVRRHLGQEEVQHLHPALSEILADTKGVFLYQEQVLRVVHELAGFSLAESDLLRRAMSHFDPGKQMVTLKEKFVREAGARKAVPADVAEQIWDMMAAFSGYGFPKAHSAAYAATAWRSAWCKAHYPAEFMAAVMANWGGYYDQSTYLLEARRLGLNVRAPHINFSESQFSVTYIDGKPQLFMGLDQLRDLTRETQSRLISLRPFVSLADLLTRAFPRKGEARNLIEVGALEGFGSIPNLLTELETGTWKRGQLPLFSPDADPVDDWSAKAKADAQERLLGVNLVSHPLDVYEQRIRAARAVSTVEAAGRFNQDLRIAGMRQTWRRIETSSGKYLYFMDLADLEGTMRVVIAEEVYNRDRNELAAKAPLLLEGRLEMDRDSTEPLFRASRIERLDRVRTS